MNTVHIERHQNDYKTLTFKKNKLFEKHVYILYI